MKKKPRAGVFIDTALLIDWANRFTWKAERYQAPDNPSEERILTLAAAMRDRRHSNGPMSPSIAFQELPPTSDLSPRRVTQLPADRTETPCLERFDYGDRNFLFAQKEIAHRIKQCNFRVGNGYDRMRTSWRCGRDSYSASKRQLHLAASFMRREP